MHPIVDDAGFDVASMLDVDIVGDANAARVNVIRHKLQGLQDRAIPNFGVDSDSDWVKHSLQHCSIPDIALSGDEDISQHCAAGRNFSGGGNYGVLLLDVHYIFMSVQWLQMCDIKQLHCSLPVQLQPRLLQNSGSSEPEYRCHIIEEVF